MLERRPAARCAPLNFQYSKLTEQVEEVNYQYRKKKARASKERSDLDSFDVVAGPIGRR
jgi:hypothetical protein